MPSLHGFSSRSGDAQPLSQYVAPGKFGRMFPQLPPLFQASTTPEIEMQLKALEELGEAMVDNSEEVDDNENIPAGYTYLGQFIDHDLTFDSTTLGETIIDPLALFNYRTPKLDLDSLYGGGPKLQPYFYHREDEKMAKDEEMVKFELGKVKVNKFRFPNINPNDPKNKDLLSHDLPRSFQGYALIGDPRNDENLFVAQLHLAFLKFHNKVVQEIMDKKGELYDKITEEFFNPSSNVFEVARKIVVWHYQWIVLYDFLPKITNLTEDDIKERVQQERLFNWKSKEPFIPVEFSVAAFRLGHSMIRKRYHINSRMTTASLREILFFTGSSGNMGLLPAIWMVNWKKFFKIDNKITPNFSQRINTKLVNPFHGVKGAKALSVRNLQRGWRVGLPSGQSIANFLGFKPLTSKQILEHATETEKIVLEKYGFDKNTPLWFYILKEAEIQKKPGIEEGQGHCLGELGSYILVEVFIYLLRADSSSFIAQNKNWKSSLPTMADLLTYVDDIDPLKRLLDFPKTS